MFSLNHRFGGRVRTGLPYDELATVLIPITIAMGMGRVFAVVIPITMLDLERRMAIAFLGLGGALQTGECEDAESGRAGEGEELRTHWKLLSRAGKEGE
jgi:hypothetical protein